MLEDQVVKEVKDVGQSEELKELMDRAEKSSIELAESFPVKGGDIVPKKEGGWLDVSKVARVGRS